MAYSVLNECKNCSHRAVCSKKQWYETMQGRIRNIDNVCSDVDIQVSIECQHYLRGIRHSNQRSDAYDLGNKIIKSNHPDF